MSEQIDEIWISVREKAPNNAVLAVSNRGNLKYGDGSVRPAKLYAKIMVDRKFLQISHLIAEHFVRKTEEDMRLGRNLVDHITHTPDGMNINDFRNIRWCTHKENSNFCEAKTNMRKGMRGRARSEFGNWFNSIFPDGHFNHVNEYAYYYRRYRETGKLPTTLDYSANCRGAYLEV